MGREATIVVDRKRREATTAFTTEGTTFSVNGTTLPASDNDTTIIPRRKREATTVVPLKRREGTTAFTTEGTTFPADDTTLPSDITRETATSDDDTPMIPRKKREATTVVPRKRREATTAFATEGTALPADDTTFPTEMTFMG